MKKRFEVLDAFRGLAAICVVIYHMNWVGSITELDFFRGSSIFVALFFVLSGFVLVHGYGDKKNLAFFGFMKARFYRLYPLHFFMFMVFLLIEIGKLAAYQYGGLTFNNIPFTGSTAISEVLPNLLLIQSWTPRSDYLSFNYPSWSISIEFYLYFLLFLSIAIFNKFKYIIWLTVAASALYMISTESFFSPVLSGLSCFFGGALMYLLYKKIAYIRIQKLSGSIMEVLIVMAVVMVVKTDFFYREIAATFLFYLAILAFSFESGIVSSLLKLKPFQLLGKLSYSIYMTHAAIIFCLISTMLVLQKLTGLELAQTINENRYLTLGGAGVNNLMLLATLTLVIFTSSLTYRHIELKWQNKGREKYESSSD